jgi:mono/diheme cytochrome c family protein
MKYIPVYALMIVILLTGCGSNEEKSDGLPGMGMGSGMSARHHAVVPEEFTVLHSPELSDADIVKGGKLYSTFCASCHGDGGMGDGPTAASLDPAPAPVAHTSSMLSDGYLYWRISEGGTSFQSTMPAWKNNFNEAEIWSIIGYMRALGTGEVVPERTMGGESYDPAAEAEFHEQMLAQAVDMGLVTNTESETFLLVHDALDEYRTANTDDLPQGNADEMQSVILEALVKDGTITQSQADDFARIHQLLLDEGLME